MHKINYLEIFKKAWNITWNNKYLWWFGFFITLGSGANVFNFNFPSDSKSQEAGELQKIVENFLSQNWQMRAARIAEIIPGNTEYWIVGGIVFLLIVLFILVIVRVVSQAGLITEANNIEKEKGSFWKGFGKGKTYFWKIFLVDILLGFLMVGIILIMIIPILFLFYLGSILSGIISIILAIFIIIPLSVLVFFLKRYAHFYIILSQLKIFSSIESAYFLFKKNIWSSIIMSLLFIPIGFILALMLIFSALMIGLAFLIIGFVLYFTLGLLGTTIAIILGAVALFAAMFLIFSAYKVFAEISWLLFFKEIATPKEEELVEEKSVEIVSDPEIV